MILSKLGILSLVVCLLYVGLRLEYAMIVFFLKNEYLAKWNLFLTIIFIIVKLISSFLNED